MVSFATESLLLFKVPFTWASACRNAVFTVIHTGKEEVGLECETTAGDKGTVFFTEFSRLRKWPDCLLASLFLRLENDFATVYKLAHHLPLTASQLKSLEGLRDSVTTDEKLDKSVWERSESVDHAMRLSTFKLHIYRYALVGSLSWYELG